MTDLTENMLRDIDKDLTRELKQMQAAALDAASTTLGRSVTLTSFHGIIGGKNNMYTDVIHTAFPSPDVFIASWYNGLLTAVNDIEGSQRMKYGRIYQNTTQHDHLRLARHPVVQKYMEVFFARNFYRQFKERTRTKPRESHTSLWFGKNGMVWGLMISPVIRNGDWTNDVSEIRRANYVYWSVGHVLSTGIIDPTNNSVMKFTSLTHLLQFCQSVLKRTSVSAYEQAIWDKYIARISDAPNPSEEPFLIPELRYAGRTAKHKYRMDFTILNAHTQEFVGFELSPQSTHMQVEGKGKTLRAHNDELRGKWNRESTKRNSFFAEYGITTVTFSDEHLTDLDECFEEMEKYLGRRAPTAILSVQRAKIAAFPIS